MGSPRKAWCDSPRRVRPALRLHHIYDVVLARVLDHLQAEIVLRPHLGRRRVIDLWSWRHTALRTVEQYRALLAERAA